jgi:hypothetical protein
MVIVEQNEIFTHLKSVIEKYFRIMKLQDTANSIISLATYIKSSAALRFEYILMLIIILSN